MTIKAIRSFFSVLLIIGALLALSSCGKTGPLYLPDSSVSASADGLIQALA